MCTTIKDIQEELSYARKLKQKGVKFYSLFNQDIDEAIQHLENLIDKRLKDIQNECS